MKRGWKNARAHGDAESSDYFDSVIYYGDKAGSKEAATALKALINPSEIKPLDAAEIAALNASVASPDDPASQVYADVVAVVGQTFDTLAPEKVKALPADVKARIATDRSRDLAAWKKAQKGMGHSIMYPTKLPNDTVTGDPQIKSYPAFRRYKLRGKNALHVTYYETSDGGQDDVRRADPRLGDAAAAADAQRDSYAEQHRVPALLQRREAPSRRLALEQADVLAVQLDRRRPLQLDHVGDRDRLPSHPQLAAEGVT